MDRAQAYVQGMKMMRQCNPIRLQDCSGTIGCSTKTSHKRMCMQGMNINIAVGTKGPWNCGRTRYCCR
jgi:hypothetical protein